MSYHMSASTDRHVREGREVHDINRSNKHRMPLIP